MSKVNQEFDEPVQTIIEWWLPQVQEILDNNFLSFYLSGSAVLGDYCPGWSDVDICVVTKSALDRETSQKLANLHDQMKALFENDISWKSGQYIEGYYVSQDLIKRDINKDWSFVAGGVTRRFFFGNPITPFDRYMLANYGQCIEGKSIRIPDAKKTELADQTRKDLKSLQDFQNQTSIWLCGMLHWIARTTVFWRDNIMLSKTAALRIEIQSGGLLVPAYRLALDVRINGSHYANQFREQLLGMYCSFVQPATEDISGFVDAVDPS